MLSATFSGDQIAVLRVHWDQASVLKQLRVISDRNKWPVRSGETVDALRNPTSVPLNPFAPNNELATPLVSTWAITLHGSILNVSRLYQFSLHPLQKRHWLLMVRRRRNLL